MSYVQMLPLSRSEGPPSAALVPVASYTPRKNQPRSNNITFSKFSLLSRKSKKDNSITSADGSDEKIGELDTVLVSALGPVDQLKAKGIVKLSPLINPLESILEPRDEQVVSRNWKSTDSVTTNPIKAARIRGETSRMVSLRNSDEELVNFYEYQPFVSNRVGNVRSYNAYNKVETTRLLDVDYISTVSAQTIGDVCLWKSYIDSYRKGQYNITDPPDPPKPSAGFAFFPPFYPPNETSRMKRMSQYDCIWPSWSKITQYEKFKLAEEMFKTPYASLSFFDEKHETFKAERGYGRGSIDRVISIGSHVLCSTEVLVVLDTMQDWRFENNPLVHRGPKIRFYAGAPIVTSDGEVLGVFAIFDRKPKTSFTLRQRRELADLSSEVMEDFDKQLSWLLKIKPASTINALQRSESTERDSSVLDDFETEAGSISDTDLRSTPMLERDSVINGDYLPQNIISPVIVPREPETPIAPLSLSYREERYLADQDFRAHNSRYIFNELRMDTPPPSADIDDGGFHEFYGTMQPPVGSGATWRIGTPEYLLTHDSGGHRVGTPRPFSSSDITSLYAQPPNTPSKSLRDKDELFLQSELTVSNARSMSDSLHIETIARDEEFRQEPGNIVDADGNWVKVYDVGDLVQFKDISTEQNSATHSGYRPVADQALRRTWGLNSWRTRLAPKSDSMPGSLSNSKDAMAEAAHACAYYAHDFGYDRIYIVEIKPWQLSTTAEKFLSAGGLEMKILTANGFTERIDISTQAYRYLQVLRSTGCHVWDDEYVGEHDYQTSCLVAIHSEEMDPQHRTSGLVMGAFRKSRRTIDLEQALKLVMAGESLREIILSGQRSHGVVI